ncbi:MAG: penicillin acylase family protein, partial [Vicinamibacteria bacterium]
HHGPVLYENKDRHRAYAVRWSGAETGGAGYVGALGMMQSRNWPEFKTNMARAWFLPSHSIVYADVEGNIGYLGVSLAPVRRNWDGLLPVPGKDGKYEWEGYVGYDKLPGSFNREEGFYNTSNNDVIPKIVPGYSVPLGFEYGAPYRYDRVHEVLTSKPKMSITEMQVLQQDALSIPARTLVPLLLKVKFDEPELVQAQKILAGWDFVLGKDSSAAAIYEFFQMKLPRLAYAPHVPETERATFKRYDYGRVIKWMTDPDAAYGSTSAERAIARDRILAKAFAEGISALIMLRGADPQAWLWGDIHTADFVHPISLLKNGKGATDVFAIAPTRRGGDGSTVMATGNASETGNKQQHGASFSFVADVADWDRSTFLSAPGISAQPLSPNSSNLIESWAAGKGNVLAFSRKKVEEVRANTLMLEPIH